jgi:hypothetical protein
MNGRTRLDRAPLALGVAAVACLFFVVVRGRWHFIQMDGRAVVVTVAFAALAVAAGLTGRSGLAIAAGLGFFVAAVVLVAAWTAGSTLIRGNGSTAAVWLGLGMGLLVTGLAGRVWPDEREGTDE